MHKENLLVHDKVVSNLLNQSKLSFVCVPLSTTHIGILDRFLVFSLNHYYKSDSFQVNLKYHKVQCIDVNTQGVVQSYAYYKYYNNSIA